MQTAERVVSSVVTTQEELEEWLVAVGEATGDPSAGTCLLFVPWATVSTQGRMQALWHENARALLLQFDVDGGATRVLPLDVSMEGQVLSESGALHGFHIRKVCDGVWTLDPSLNIPEVVHGFVVLHGVPDPAPWEKRIILAGA